MTLFDGLIFLVSWLAELRAITFRTLFYKTICFREKNSRRMYGQTEVEL